MDGQDSAFHLHVTGKEESFNSFFWYFVDISLILNKNPTNNGFLNISFSVGYETVNWIVFLLLYANICRVLCLKLWVDIVLMHDFVAQRIGRLKNTGSLS